MSPNHSSLILFDCDGTLVDSHNHIIRTVQQSFIHCGLEEPCADEAREVIGFSLFAAICKLLPESEQKRAEYVCSVYRNLYVQNGNKGSEPLYPGVKTTLTNLIVRGYSLGIVTGKSTKGLMRIFEQHAFEGMFSVWRSADQCPSKPHPAMVLECMQETDISPDRTVVVGDSCMDMEMASESGVAALGVSYGAQKAERLLATGANAVVDCMPDLLTFFPSLSNANQDMMIMIRKE
ncbi:MAG: HAD-IA family hydrolase [Mariprofundaceae bacterium]